MSDENSNEADQTPVFIVPAAGLPASNIPQNLRFTVGRKLGAGIAVTMFIFALIGGISYKYRSYD